MNKANAEKIIEKHIMDILIKCKVFDFQGDFIDKDFERNLSHCLGLVKNHISKIEEKFLRSSNNISNTTYTATKSNLTTTNTNATITIKQRAIRYTKIKNQEKEFRKFLHQNIKFRTDDASNRPKSVDSYISRINSISQKVSLHCRDDFHLLCFMGDNADIDYIFDFAISLNVFSDKFITDRNSAISHYKNFNLLHKKHNNKEV